MWIVQLALRRPYTFVVMAMLIVILGVLAIFRMPTDIFPEINIPVVSVIWSYARSLAGGDGGSHHHPLRALLHHLGQRYRAHGIAVAAGARGDQGLLPSRTPRSRRRWRNSRPPRNRCCIRCPPASLRPAILRYNASSVPILQLSISSDTLTEQAALRSRLQLHPHADGQRAGRELPAALRRPARARSWWTSIRRRSVRAGSLGQRRGQRHQRAEPDSALRARPRSARANTPSS